MRTHQRRTWSQLVSALAFTVAAVCPLHGQTARAGGSTVFLTVIDTGANAVGRPYFIETFVPATPGGAPANLASPGQMGAPGRFRIDNLPGDSVRIDIGCQVLRLLDGSQAGRAKWVVRLFLREGVVRDTTVRIGHAGCDPRPIRTESRVFSGLWTTAFEVNDFSPCTGDGWTIPADSVVQAGLGASAWIEFTPAGHRTLGRLPWPKPPLPDTGVDRTWYVRWHGRIVGPDRYGHGGLNPFLLTVDSVIAIASPDSAHCAE